MPWPSRNRLRKSYKPSLRMKGNLTSSSSDMREMEVATRRDFWRPSFIHLPGEMAVERVQRLLPLLLLLAAFGLYLPRLSTPQKYLFDEILFAYTAGEYANGNADAYFWDDPCSVGKNKERCAEINPEAVKDNRIGRYEWTHPLLGKDLIAITIVAFGNTPFGWRIASTVCGTIGIILAYHLGVTVTGRRGVGILTAGLLLLDGLYFVYSRLGLVDIYVTVFMLGALLAFAKYVMAPPDRTRGPLIAIGAMLGLGIATKWSSGYAATLIGCMVLWRLLGLFRASRQENVPPQVRQGIRDHLIWIPISFGILPIVLYLFAYLPFFFEGYRLIQFVELQKAMFQFHTHLPKLGQASKWWEWPLTLQPMWFGSRSLADGRVANTYANGNPLLYWAFLPAIAWLSVYWFRMRHPALVVLLIGFFGQWLPWILVGRSSFIYHFLPAVPFGCLAVAMAVTHLYRGNTGWRRTLAVEYVVLVALAFVFFYPIYSFAAISERALALRMWLPDWPR